MTKTPWIVLAGLLAMTPMAPVWAQEPPATAITENTWRGALTDWGCKQAQVDQVCPVGPGTKEFALSVDGGILLRLDERGNELTAQALRETGAAGSVSVEIVGEHEGRLLKVESVRIVTDAS